MSNKLPVLPWITDLESVLGLHEVRDKAKLSAYLKSDGKRLGDPSKLPWCGDAVDTSMTNALPKEPRPGALGENPYWARNWALFGVQCNRVYGCVGVFVRNGGGHVGYLVGITADKKHYLVLGGNQGDTVSVKPIAVDRCIATRWPSTSKHSQVLLPIRKLNGEVSTNEA